MRSPSTVTQDVASQHFSIVNIPCFITIAYKSYRKASVSLDVRIKTTCRTFRNTLIAESPKIILLESNNDYEKRNRPKETLDSLFQPSRRSFGPLVAFFSRQAGAKRRQRQSGFEIIPISKLDWKSNSRMRLLRLIPPPPPPAVPLPTDRQCGGRRRLSARPPPPPITPSPPPRLGIIHFSGLSPLWALGVSSLFFGRGGHYKHPRRPPLPRGHGKGALCLNTVLPPPPTPSHPRAFLGGTNSW